MTPLDDPVRAALTGPQAHLAVEVENVLRFRADVAPFMAPAADAWRVVSSFEVVQMTAGRALGERGPEIIALGDHRCARDARAHAVDQPPRTEAGAWPRGASAPSPRASRRAASRSSCTSWRATRCDLAL